jgi:hypothetical protein
LVENRVAGFRKRAKTAETPGPLDEKSAIAIGVVFECGDHGQDDRKSALT